jgi:hypothetical protein
VCQLAAASALVLNYGWPTKQVRLEPNKQDLGNLAYGVDLIVSEHAGGRAVVYGEAKANLSEARKLIREITSCGAAGNHESSSCKRSQHPKFAACWERRPTYFWVVCPGSRKAFRWEFTDTSLKFVEVDDIPRAEALSG